VFLKRYVSSLLLGRTGSIKYTSAGVNSTPLRALYSQLPTIFLNWVKREILLGD